MTQPGEPGAPALLIYADSERSAALRHELPISIGDPLTLIRTNGEVHVQASSLEEDRIRAALPNAIIHSTGDLGFYELIESGASRPEVELELVSRMVANVGAERYTADPELPLVVADRLRADGVELEPAAEAFAMRRRSKSPEELAGIRRAQVAADAAMAAAAEAIRTAEVDGDRLIRNGEPLTAEMVREALRDACRKLGAPAPADVIVASVWQGFGHESGSGPLPAGLPIQVDLWPQDEESACWADMTRTFLVGEPPEEIREQERLVTEAIESVRSQIRPGVTGRELHVIACDIFEGAGWRTLRTGPDPEHPNDGFQFSLGHGIGLQIHEPPGMGQSGREPLIAGDVVAIEPGLWDHKLGGVRFEDIVLVTEDGAETLTDYPYDLAP